MPQLLPSTFPLPFYMEIRSHYSSAQICLMATILFPIKNCVFSHSVMSDSFATPWTVAYQAPLSMKFFRQEHWSGLPFPPPGDLLDPGIESASPVSPALAGRHITTVPPRKPHFILFPINDGYWSLPMPSSHAHCRLLSYPLASAYPLPLAKESLLPDTHQFILSFILYFTFMQNVRLTLTSASTPYFAFSVAPNSSKLWYSLLIHSMCCWSLSDSLLLNILRAGISVCFISLSPTHKAGLQLTMSKYWGRKERNREGRREKGREERVIWRCPVQWEGQEMYPSRHRCTQNRAESYVLMCLLISKPRRCTDTRQSIRE